MSVVRENDFAQSTQQPCKHVPTLFGKFVLLLKAHAAHKPTHICARVRISTPGLCRSHNGSEIGTGSETEEPCRLQRRLETSVLSFPQTNCTSSSHSFLRVTSGIIQLQCQVSALWRWSSRCFKRQIKSGV